MAKTPRGWIVEQHDPLQKLEDNLWAVQGRLPGSPLPRRMEIVRLRDGRLVFHAVVTVDDATIRPIEAWGEPAFMIVPNDLHRLDAHAWRERYPKARFLAPTACRAKIEQVVKIDGPLEELPADPSLTWETSAGWKNGEPIVRVSSNGRSSLLFSDVVFNVPHGRGFGGFVMKAIGSSGTAPKVTRVGRLLQLQDAKALRAQLERLAADPALHRLVPCHGDVVEGDAGAALARAAQAL